MKFLLFYIYVTFVFFSSSIAHEADLARNIKEDGDAKAWFFEIKCEGK